MKLDSSCREPRVPMVVLYLAGTVVGLPFFLLALALTPLNETWLTFAVGALPFTALAALWLWARRPSTGGSNGSVGVLAQDEYQPGA
jgi:hypothetical protein